MYGDSEVTRKRVAQLREQGTEIRALADRLVAQAEAVPWHGRAAEAMRARIKERAAQLRAAAGGHDTAADSLARHVHEVETAKEAIAAREERGARIVEDARSRAAAAEEAGGQPDDEDRPLLAFDPPPAGHKDWLTTSLPGL